VDGVGAAKNEARTFDSPLPLLDYLAARNANR
jgi:hypothetical protein